jgi:hypothetical protein
MENYLQEAEREAQEVEEMLELPTEKEEASEIEVMIDQNDELPVPEPSNPSKPNIRPVRCFLCDCDFDSTPEMHFEIHHIPDQMMSCTKCEFQIDSPWYMNLHKQLHSEGEETFIK